MKKIFSFILLFLFVFLLASCDDNLSKISYTVKFYEDDILLNEKTYDENELIKVEDILNTNNLVLDYLVNRETGERWDFDNLVINDYLFDVYWSNEILNNYQYNIYYLNDTHGAVLEDSSELGLGKIGNYIKKVRKDNDLFVTGGDILQGQLISNANRGAVMMEVFNELNLDAFVIGNHEFDWGLETILEYFNPNTEGVKANFPLLGANVIDTRTNKIPNYMQTHTIVERGDISIGIIGVIGDGLESSIAYKRVKDYRFTDAYSAVLQTANQIKDEVDFIIVVNHSDNDRFNERVAKIDKVAAVFNGHSHQEKKGFVFNNAGVAIPWIQSRHNGYMVGRVTLDFDLTSSGLSLVNGDAQNIKSSVFLNSEDLEVKAIIDRYYQEVEHLYTDILLVSDSYYSQSALANYIARLMREVTGSVAGFQNSGGTRTSFSQNQKITASDIFQVFPFDNTIIVSEVKGEHLKQLLNDSYFFIDSNIVSQAIDDNEYYKVVTNDYVFYSPYNQYAFANALNVVDFGDMYETFYEVMLNLRDEGYTKFNTSLPIIY